MTIHVRYPLLVNHVYESGAHQNDVFKNDFRSKASAEAYFNGTFGAGTLTFSGTENTDYEFDATNGFRTLTNTGGAKLLMNNILTGDALTYWMYGGMTMDFQVLTDEWIEPAPAPTSAYINPVTDMDGTATTLNNTYLLNFGNNNALGHASVMAKDDAVTTKTKGRNKLHFAFSPNAANPNCASRPCTRFNKGDFLSCRMTLLNNTGAAWIDQMPAIPAHAANAPSYAGPHFGRATSTAMNLSLQTAGNAVIWIGQYGTNASACTRWIRNLRMYNAPTDYSYHHWLARVLSFGDSFTATQFGPAAVGATSQVLGGAGDDGEYSTAAADVFEFCDTAASLRYHQLLLQAGYNVGGMYGAGQGGYYFSVGGATSLVDAGYKDRLITNLKPTFCFTFGLHNDVALIGAGTTDIATLQTLLLDTYLAPVMASGCHGWGFVIPAMDKSLSTSGYTAAFDAVADMLLGLPAAFDAAYPAYVGRVKVSDARTEMGMDWSNNRNWRTYYSNADTVHPTSYGKNIFAVRCAQMTLEWLRGA